MIPIIKKGTKLTASLMRELARGTGKPDIDGQLFRIFPGWIRSARLKNQVTQGEAELIIYSTVDEDFIRRPNREIQYFDPSRRTHEQLAKLSSIGYFIWRGEVAKWELLKPYAGELQNTLCEECDCRVLQSTSLSPSIPIGGLLAYNTYRIYVATYPHTLTDKSARGPFISNRDYVDVVHISGNQWAGVLEYGTNDINVYYGYEPYECVRYDVSLKLYEKAWVDDFKELNGVAVFTPSADYCAVPDETEVVYNSFRPLDGALGKAELSKVTQADYMLSEIICLTPKPSSTSTRIVGSPIACLENIDLEIIYPAAISVSSFGQAAACAYNWVTSEPAYYCTSSTCGGELSALQQELRGFNQRQVDVSGVVSSALSGSAVTTPGSNSPAYGPGYGGNITLIPYYSIIKDLPVFTETQPYKYYSIAAGAVLTGERSVSFRGQLTLQAVIAVDCRPGATASSWIVTATLYLYSGIQVYGPNNPGYASTGIRAFSSEIAYTTPGTLTQKTLIVDQPSLIVTNTVTIPPLEAVFFARTNDNHIIDPNPVFAPYVYGMESSIRNTKLSGYYDLLGISGNVVDDFTQNEPMTCAIPPGADNEKAWVLAPGLKLFSDTAATITANIQIS